MRSHREIIRAAGGYRPFAEKIGEPESRVRFWERRDSIPSEAWRRVQAADLATLAELAIYAEERATRSGQDAVHPDHAA